MRPGSALFVIVLFVSSFSVSAFAQEPAPGTQVFVSDDEIRYDYAIWLPVAYESDDAWPLIVYLHGGTAIPEGVTPEPVDLPAYLEDPQFAFNNHPTLTRFVVVSPVRREPAWLTGDLNHLLDSIEADYRIDRSRIYLTGYSLGGFATWAWASSDPHRFASIAPIAASDDFEAAVELREILYLAIFGPDVAEETQAFVDANPDAAIRGDAQAIAALPTWTEASDNDPLIPYEYVLEFIDEIRNYGGDPILITHKRLYHDFSDRAYDSELYNWFLQHRRETANADRWSLFR